MQEVVPLKEWCRRMVLSPTPTGGFLDDFIHNFSSTVGCERSLPSRGGSEAGSLGTDPGIELGDPPAGWTDELGLDNPLDLIGAVTGLLHSEGTLPSNRGRNSASDDCS